MKQKKKLNQTQKMHNAYLVGPFVGELTWEFFRFAPYIIHLKKHRPKTKIVVFTRPSRFDLYGQYADILVPLRIPNSVEKQNCFTINGVTNINYEKLAKSFFEKYKKRFNIIDHIYPDISYYYYKLKWQFPRNSMDYDFKPRKQNVMLVDEYVNNKVAFINFNFSEEMKVTEQLEKQGVFPMFINMITDDFLALNDKDSSLLGCIIELLKRSEFVVTKFDSYITHLSLLVGTPVIVVGEAPTYDSLSLINPMGTKVFSCENSIDGINLFFGEGE